MRNAAEALANIAPRVTRIARSRKLPAVNITVILIGLSTET